MWVDRIVEEILAGSPEGARARHVINDAKTPSGYIHVGSLRGVILHDCIYRGLTAAGAAVEYLYGFDDLDPMDDLPTYLGEEFQKYMGMPLCHIPSPDPRAESYARYFGEEFIEIFTATGCHPKVYWTSDLYLQGRFNEAIRLVLDRAEEIREIEREVRGSRRLEGRYPLHVICERCGKIGTTAVIGWDGREVEYECRPDLVTWAQGCGYRGVRSPFNGNAKLPYRIEWAAKWQILGVTVEGAGKDHFTRGGSHDVAAAISTRIFHYPVPYPIPYEFVLTGGGRKMSSSRAVGVFAREIMQVLRPELVRFLMVRNHPRRPIEFEPDGETIPRLYDEYDRAAAAYFGEIEDPDLARTFFYARIEGEQPRCFRMRFSKVAFLLQMPNVDLVVEATKEKGSPLTSEDREELAQRVRDARKWLETYAPDHYRFTVQEVLPPAASQLSPEQREFLKRLAQILEEREWPGEELHGRIHALKEEMGLAAREAFAAIYLVLLGKDSGPQAGWFLAALDRAFVIQRFREASALLHDRLGGGLR
ncbi:MAG: lysine--tRNA ligase [Armatimonadota bacterium]|nr:lysine--tRNA ligase [Armatimonadota bacterium]